MVEKTVIVEKAVVQEKIVVEEKTVYVDRSPASSKSSTSRPEPKFKAGQAVHQWWAPWMAGATKMRVSVGKKGRPAWYSASVVVPLNGQRQPTGASSSHLGRTRSSDGTHRLTGVHCAPSGH